MGTLGSYFLSTYQFQEGNAWLWAAFVFLAGFFAILLAASVAVLAYVRYDRSLGSSRISSPGTPAAASLGGPAAVGAGKTSDAAAPSPQVAPVPASAVAIELAPAAPALAANTAVIAVSSTSSSSSGLATAHALPFSPATLSFEGITYDVTLSRKAGGGTRRLLQGISGVAYPGSITLMMGASGAGKSTLMDAVSGRKNAGTMGGTVYVDGVPANTSVMARATAYVEQLDTPHPVSMRICMQLRSLPASAIVDRLDMIRFHLLSCRACERPVDASSPSAGRASEPIVHPCRS